jgi:hypothetical protein
MLLVISHLVKRYWTIENYLLRESKHQGRVNHEWIR